MSVPLSVLDNWNWLVFVCSVQFDNQLDVYIIKLLYYNDQDSFRV